MDKFDEQLIKNLEKEYFKTVKKNMSFEDACLQFAKYTIKVDKLSNKIENLRNSIYDKTNRFGSGEERANWARKYMIVGILSSILAISCCASFIHPDDKLIRAMVGGSLVLSLASGTEIVYAPVRKSFLKSKLHFAHKKFEKDLAKVYTAQILLDKNYPNKQNVDIGEYFLSSEDGEIPTFCQSNYEYKEQFEERE